MGVHAGFRRSALAVALCWCVAAVAGYESSPYGPTAYPTAYPTDYPTSNAPAPGPSNAPGASCVLVSPGTKCLDLPVSSSTSGAPLSSDMFVYLAASLSALAYPRVKGQEVRITPGGWIHTVFFCSTYCETGCFHLNSLFMVPAGPVEGRRHFRCSRFGSHKYNFLPPICH